MTYGVYLTIDQKRWARGDYSSSNKLTGTIYSDAAKTTAYSLSGYTLTIRIFKRWTSGDLFNKTADIVNAANGTWSYAVASSDMPTTGLYLIEVELSKSGEIMSTFPQEFHIVQGPSG